MHPPLNPVENYILLETDGTATPLPGGEPFWKQLMSGEPTDAGIQRLMNAEHGRLLSAFQMDADWTVWEMHPAGDEILFLISGAFTLIVEEDGEARPVELTAGKIAIVPKGIWHTARVSQPCQLLALTDGLGTQHRPV